MVNVLITDGYARQTLPMSKGFKELGCTVTVICFSKLDVGYASKHTDIKLMAPCKKDEYEKQEEYVVSIIKSNRYDLVVPMTDYSAAYLSKNKETLSKYAKIAVNDPEIFKNAIDKTNTAKICEIHGIFTPVTLFSDNPAKEMEQKNITFPIVLKPVTACGSIGFNIVKSKEGLDRLLFGYDGKNGPLFIQEYIPSGGCQYNVHMFMDKTGVRRGTVVSVKRRWFPLDGGAATFTQTVKNDEVVAQCEKLLKAIGWNGYADLDLIEDLRDGKIKVLEINPRISANVKLCFFAGVNIARLIYDNELGEQVESMNEYIIDRRMRCALTDILWFLNSKDRFTAKPSWFSTKRTCGAVFSLDDIKPSLTFCIQSVLNFRRSMSQRKRG